MSPQVNRYGGAQVAPTGIPSVDQAPYRIRPDAGDYGADIGARVAQFGSAIYGKALQIQKDEQTKQDEVVIQAAESKLSDWELKAIYDPKDGALAQQGTNAFHLPDTVGQSFDDKASELRSVLNDRQRPAFDRVIQNRKPQVMSRVQAHVMGQMQQVADQSIKSYVDNSQELAVQNASDPARVASEIDNGRIHVALDAQRRGLDADTTKALVDGVTSDYHVGVINQLLATGQTTMAQQHFDAAKDEIVGPNLQATEAKLTQIKESLKTGEVRTTGRVNADTIFNDVSLSNPDFTLTDLLDKADDIADTDVHDETVNRLKDKWSVMRQQRSDENIQRNADIKARLDMQFQAGVNTVEATHAIDQIPPEIWNSYTLAERNQLRSYAKTLSEGKKIETDLRVYLPLIRAAADPKTEQQFAALDFNAPKYLNTISEAHRIELTKMQAAIQKGDKDAVDTAVRPLRDMSEMVNKVLTERGVDKKSKDPAVMQQVEDLWTQIEGARAGILKDSKRSFLTGPEQQQIIDQIHIQKAVDNWDLWGLGTPDVPASMGLDEIKQLPMPANVRDAIVKSLRKAGEDVTEANIHDYFVELNRRNRGGP